MSRLNNTLQFPYLILASASPRRKEFLAELNIPLKVIPPHIAEKDDTKGDPAQIALHNAEIKAQAIAKEYPNDLILAADTVVSLGQEIFHKPKDLADASAMLQRFSGKKQSVYTGLCFVSSKYDIQALHCIQSDVIFKSLNAELINKYIQLVDPLDRAGGWSIQDHADLIIEGYEGSFSNIAGLPVEFIQNWFKQEDITFC